MTNNVFITGGSRGIGAAAVLAFARAGYNVAFTYNSHPDAADAVRRQAEEINPGGLYLAIRADAGDPAQVRAAVARAEQELGSLQVLVCNAGIAQVKLFTDTTDEDWRRMMAVDLDGAFYACRAVLPGMIHRKYGRILLVSSMWGQTGGSCEVAYSAAKAGLIGLGKALAKEEGPSGITVNVIAPGVINTDMMAGFTDEDRAALAEETPVERLGEPDEIARTMVFLADEASGYITGQVLGVNGGLVSCTLNNIDWMSLQGDGAFADPIESLRDCRLKYNTFTEMNLTKFKFAGSVIQRSMFAKCNLVSADFEKCDLLDTEFFQCDMRKANFKEASGYKVDIFGCKLQDAKFSLPEAVSLLGDLRIKLL